MLTIEQVDCIVDKAECSVYSTFHNMAEKSCYMTTNIEEQQLADWQLLYTVRNLKDNWIDDPRFQCLAKRLMQ